MLTPVVPLRPRKNPPRRYARFGPPPPVEALTLVAATYNHVVEPVVILTFDRAIDIAGMDGSLIVVDDADDLGLLFRGNGGWTLDSPTTVRVVLLADGDATGVGTTLTAGAGNHIVAAGDGAEWAGVADLGLPFP